MNLDLLQKAANQARGLAMDAVHDCASGHLGLPLGCAEIGAVLFGDLLNICPAQPRWLNRDRFILSAGHGSMFLYGWLHLSGFNIGIEDLKGFRHKGSITPGHPEFRDTEGVECTTGPLGQGIANAVGFALSARRAAARFNKPGMDIFTQHIFCLTGDGCLQEGVARESLALAAVLKLDNLILIYDSNDITLDAPAERTQLADPRTNMRSARNNWDFWTSLPEAFHQVTVVMSDRGIPSSYRHMHGFGNHAFSMLNADNERVWVKFHLKTQQGIKNLTDAEAEAIIAKDRESHQRDLYESIERKDFPRWTMYIQVMTQEQAKACPFNPFDLTKVWPHGDYPLMEVGVLELNRNPDNYFAQIEQAAFNPANVVPGIGFSPDKMLQGRLFSYGDAQRYRLGVNHNQIPVNAPRCPFHSYHRDGMMRVDDNAGSTLGYEPNSYGEWQEQPEFREPPLELDGAAWHWDFREDDDDYYSQPRALFRLMNPEQREALYGNTARAMGDAPDFIKQRHIDHCMQCDPEYGEGVAKALGMFKG